MAEYTPQVSDDELRRMFAAVGIFDERRIVSALTNPIYRQIYERQYKGFSTVEKKLAAHGESFPSPPAGRGRK